MVVPQRLCIVDSSVLIDLEYGGLIKEIFQLDQVWASPDMVILEVKNPLGSLLMSFGLTKIELGETETQEILRLRGNYRQLSVSDLSCLVIAQLMNIPLITGDGALRRAAEEKGVRVRGTLWILDELVRTKVIPGRIAADSLSKMKKAGGRFPPEEVSKRVKRWMP